jgi:hypothetical protein|tara:strand:+ start:3276 stop:3755 length:480 start_codon:yes stop_codon:yes gene_type:complete
MADIYTIYADHKEGVDSYDFANKMRKFLDGLASLDRMKGYRLTRSKLGFRSMDLPEFRIDMEFDNMQQLDDAMTSIIRNEKNIDKSHVTFNQLVDKETIQHFLYRDFPDKLTETQPQVKIKEPVKIEISPEMKKKMKGSWTIEEIVESMRSSYPDIWKK